ncbi:imidazolonepropionase [Fusibacter ferrireducens]|uniref:Imidazolonepropionase n=1 Tax=Fusibacter ferrireducens TaxID=2785058 RepID=A0ABR9ZXW9_9FIRM|nr:imidazolonepropionase [Fusibacter ferrireducens]MBF4694801.1 imidazolonepropionase [Fusibacter ferrireducens]
MKKGNMIILNASELVTCSGFKGKTGSEMNDLKIIENASVIVEEGLIKKITQDKIELSSYEQMGYEIIDATGKCVLPGFVDSHTHFIFGGYRQDEYDWRLKGQGYMEIMSKGGGIINSVEGTRNATFEDLYASGVRRLNSMARFGVTTVEGKSGYGLDLDTEIKQLEVMKRLNEVHSLDVVPTFLGPHARPKAYKETPDAFIDYMIEKVLPVVVEKDLAVFADIFCEENVFSVDQSRRFLSAAKAMGLKLKIHADEIVRLGGAELAAELGAVSADHLLQASDEGIKSMQAASVVTTILPCTAFSLKEDYARARAMIDADCIVALATDFNPGSCFTESIPLLVALATNQMGMTVEETITALTINGAAALGRAAQIGSIDVGKRADLVIHEFPSYKFIPYHIAVSTVEKVIKNGIKIIDLYSDQPL